MSLDSVRSGVERDKRNELLDAKTKNRSYWFIGAPWWTFGRRGADLGGSRSNIETSRKRKLRELYAVTSCINANNPPAFTFADPPADARELQFLDENDLSRARYFREDTLPIFAPAKQPAKPPRPSPTQPPVLASVSTSSTSVEPVPHHADGSETQPAAATLPARAPSPPPQDVEKPPTPAPTLSQPPADDAVKPDSAPRSVEEEAPVPSAETKQPAAPAPKPLQAPAILPPSQTHPGPLSAKARRRSSALADGSTILPDPRTIDRPARKPRTLHLPPKEVQEQRLREIHTAQERAAQRERREEEQQAAGAVGETVNGEAASSPSSTLGPHSANTSRADQHSPATSPDEETLRHDGTFPSAQPSSADKNGPAAMTPPNATPDAQLHFEESVRQVRDSAMKDAKPGTPKPKAADLIEQASGVTQNLDVAVNGVPTIQNSSTSRNAVNGIVLETSNEVRNGVFDAKGADKTKARAFTDDQSADLDVAMRDREPPKTDEASAGPTRSQDPTDGSSSAAKVAVASEAVSDPKATTKTTSTSEGIRPTSILLRGREAEYRDRERSKTTGVVFAKQDSTLALRGGQEVNKAWSKLKGAAQNPDKDYLIGMFDFQAHSGPMYSCRELLEKATKTISTQSKYASMREQQDYKILKRIYTLQHANRWSLRQMEKSTEPPRQATLHDSLLAQMKWMRTDFREERRWKMAAARNMAEWCAEWVDASPEKRRSLQVKATRKPAAPPPPADPMDEDIPSPPELIPSGANETESESFPDDDEFPINLRSSNPPATLFSLGYEEIVAKIDQTPSSEKVLQELPSYEARLSSFPSPSVLAPVSIDPEIIPVSQLITAKLVPKSTEPPRKRSRYEYEEDDESAGYSSKRPTSERSNTSTPSLRFSRVGLAPEQTDVALFLPENKHVRDRLHAGHSFRPPSEFPMPSTQFFESRMPSQWLWDEDQRLRTLVKEYQFNWSLVAASLEQSSLFTSGAERRTPWECFERWVQLEGLPGEMAKTPYFRTYQARLEAAQRTVSAQYQAAQQQAQQQGQTPGQILGTPRRRTAQPIRVERRKGNRFLALIDAMRKQARKRETAQHKQQEAAKAAALRKAHEAAPVRTSVHTPQEFSKLKYEREQKMIEKQDEYRRQVMAAQRQVMARPGQMPGHPGMSQMGQQRNGTPNGAHAQVPGQNGQLHLNMGMQARPHSGQGMQGSMPNGNMPGMPLGIPQAQMQMNMQGQRPPHQAQDMRMAMQQRNLSQQQQQYLLQQQAQQMNRANSMSGGHLASANGNGNGNSSGNNNNNNNNNNSSSSNSSSNSNSNTNNNNMQNPSMLTTNMGTPKVNGASNGNVNGMQGASASPRITAPNSAAPQQPQALSSGHVPQITNLTHEIQLQHPNLSQAEASRIAGDRMNQKLQQNARQNALNAASGAASGGANAGAQLSPSPYQQHASLATTGGSSSPPNHTPQQQAAYQQQMRQHLMQQQQQARTPSGQQGSPNLGTVRPESRSATPQQNAQQMQPGPHGSPSNRTGPQTPQPGQQGQGQQGQGGSR
ncbi:myb and hsa domain protein [Diplodia corticola]|uniref:Vacuolar import and degradation protein 21 n=1 Tax=Diplodia corticola TaxID=236234 RepID=A0A1J9RUC5_9PEZI|nr:myb and hsa domain protein [Diplodia corticola]OJD31109.1 myb and hsa domain protein [Diplodia corticola]